MFKKMIKSNAIALALVLGSSGTAFANSHSLSIGATLLENHGLYVKYDNWNVGFQNAKDSKHRDYSMILAGYLVETAPASTNPKFKVGLNLGVITQTTKDKFKNTALLISPTASVELKEGWTLRMSYIPAVRTNKKDSVVSLAVEKAL